MCILVCVNHFPLTCMSMQGFDACLTEKNSQCGLGSVKLLEFTHKVNAHILTVLAEQLGCELGQTVNSHIGLIPTSMEKAGLCDK